MWRRFAVLGLVYGGCLGAVVQAQVLELGLDGVAWETPNDTGPLLYKEVAESDLVSVKAKISSQTSGFWSQAGVIARLPNPVDQAAAQENWQAAWSFRPLEEGTWDLQHNMASAGIETEVGQTGLDSADLTYVRLDNLGSGEFQAFFGSGTDDSISWTALAGTQTNASLIGQTLQVGVAGGAIGALPEAVALFDWVEIETTGDTFRDDFDYTRDFVADGLPSPGIWDGLLNGSAGGVNVQTGDIGQCVVCNWNVNGSGDFANAANWLDDLGAAIRFAPNRSASQVVFGEVAAAGPAVVFVNKDMTVEQLTFDNTSNSYVLGGGGSISFDSEGVAGAINVLAGTHQIQVDLALLTDVTATAAAGASLDINALVSLNGNTLTVTGDGVINLNNGVVLVDGGGIVNSGAIAGLTAADGDYSQTSEGSLLYTLGKSSEIGIAGVAELGGALELSLAEGFFATPGATYTLLTADSVVDNGLVLSGDGAGQFDLMVNGTSVSVVAMSIPEPAGLVLSIGAFLAVCCVYRCRLGRPAFASARVASLFAVTMVLATSSVLADTLTLGPMDQDATYRDDFNSTFDYFTANGGVPTGTFASSLGGTASWTATHNAQFGTDGSFPSAFVANGVDGMGDPKPGLLVIEDLAFHVNTDEALGVGFEGNKNNAPMLFANVDAGDNFEATIKIEQQTSGFWSYSPIVARLSGPPVGLGTGDTLDPTEAFITAGNFRTTADDPLTEDVDESLNMATLVQNVGDLNGDGNLQEEEGQAAFTLDEFPLYLKLTKRAAQFTTSTSTDGVTFTDQVAVINPLLNSPGSLLEIGPSFMMFQGGEFGQTELDFFEITVQKQQRFTDATWSPAGATANGNWNSGGNWSSLTAPGQVPDANSVNVVLGGANAGAGAVTVYNNADVAIRSLAFTSADTYAISGLGSITLEPDALSDTDTDATFISVEAGAHEIQVPVVLSSSAASDNRVLVVPGSTLDFDNQLDLNGKTLSVEGGGVVNVNNNIDTGTTGELIVSGAVLGGSGRVNGDVGSTGGAVAPGQGVGTLTVDGDYTQDGAASLFIELAGESVGQFDVLDVLGAAILDGVLNIEYANGYLPTAADIGATWEVLTAGSVNNAAGIELDSSDASFYSLSATASSLILTLTAEPVLGLVGDYNDDGVVDAADYTVYRDAAGSATSLPNRGPGLSGVVGVGDYTAWQTNYGATTAPGSGVEAVPEPIGAAVVAMLALSAACATSSSRQRFGRRTGVE
ncbi:hypothetical protein Pla123a_32310 [Posidoniimonas polymericola]|uniref:Autotransporter-associated beta strand repeat protein n=1 Tax=Posidoniimonas polymericola TaxID=2528002 RepID=A0A5C5YLE5_9BACT|nr:hypothetical protein [Posidoniimonas polymericola]TWT75721.1 hypothetical protein Pla123a_32310 [Posidoniimonas polymericola]